MKGRLHQKSNPVLEFSCVWWSPNVIDVSLLQFCKI